MIWREAGGPEVVPPVRSGFGQTVMMRMTEMALRGHVELDYAEDGFSWRLRSPVRKTLEDEVSQTGFPEMRHPGSAWLTARGTIVNDGFAVLSS